MHLFMATACLILVCYELLHHWLQGVWVLYVLLVNFGLTWPKNNHGQVSGSLLWPLQISLSVWDFTINQSLGQAKAAFFVAFWLFRYVCTISNETSSENTAGLPMSYPHTKKQFAANRKGCDNSETTAGKRSARRIQIFWVPFSVIIFWSLIFK